MWIIASLCRSYLKYVNRKSWNIFTVKLSGCKVKVKRIRPYHGCNHKQGRRENSRGPGQNYIWGPYDVVIFKQQD